MIADEVQVEAIADRLSRGDTVEVRLYGRSMLPTIFPGIVAPLEPVTASECEAGDVVVVRRGGALSVHRWLGASSGGWVLQGDAFEEPDAPIASEQVLGRATALLVGRWAIPAPPALRRWLSRGLVRALPALRRSSRRLYGLGRSAARRGQRVRVVRVLRGVLQPIRIERLEAGDLREIHALLLRQSVRPGVAVLSGWQSLIESERGAGFVARASGRIVGYVSVREDRDDSTRGRCGFVWVDPWYRGLGVGLGLQGAVVDEGRAAGFAELVARARWGSDSMRASERLGFVASRAPDDPRWAELRLAFGASLHGA